MFRRVWAGLRLSMCPGGRLVWRYGHCIVDMNYPGLTYPQRRTMKPKQGASDVVL